MRPDRHPPDLTITLSELAIVSSRPLRLKAKAAKGYLGAKAALALSADPGRFLSTVQIGITLVGVLSGAFSGATLGVRLADLLPSLGVPVQYANPLGVGIVVLVITYLSLIIGELVPKQIALTNPEVVACRVAPAMHLLSRATLPLVWLLDHSGKLVLMLLGHSGKRGASVSDEEIRMLIAEAEGAGTIEKAETKMITGVMRIADRCARGVMTPRHEVEVARAEESLSEILARLRNSGRSRLPLRDGAQDDIVGILLSRDLLHASQEGFDPRSLARPAAVVNDALPAIQVIEQLKTAPAQMLLVYDEYGHFEGVITPMDILDAITGGFDEMELDEPKLVERADGSLLVAGWMPVDEFADHIGITLEDDHDYETVAGLVLQRGAVMPKVGEHVSVDDWRIEVIDMDGRRIDKLLVQKIPTMGETPSSPS
ncbi:hemolysin family protein [Billgrantia aerodenitrificans]|uniref:HlyC/CorC family transporter n=1 Tax=Billgrantia aerodenitrificans TaxID=2733483 RepID=A0ABS9AYY7_9GAMM|nr:hemolysin family protein [Halomonas aerodenitrificans]MCE8026897.1 HlyC/CorC family transporter [Halomonas aerodenitrificans]